ncbi:MAG: hypothetical protein EOM48_10590 [Bacilli bacterium]|nr:hypothetical protein [Bacilli bacterium]
MNFDDYHQIMHDRKSKSNPMAEEHLAAAMVCHHNIKLFKQNGDDCFFIQEMEQKKDRYIQKAIDESWGADEMDYPHDWDANCKEIRKNLYESGITQEIKFERGASYLTVVNKIKRG